ncbi:MAG: glycosyl transferase family 2 [Paenibacillaceae bacterium]|nr:glycosyl transferase family 2 [Paenibacillaceae bacterium]
MAVETEKTADKAVGEAGISNSSSFTIVIPAFNEAQSLPDVLDQTLAAIRSWAASVELIVVDDCSTDDTASVVRQYSEAGVRLVRHETNRGPIAALMTGIQAASCDCVVTMDADGQHSPDDLPQMVAPIVRGEADLVVGIRPRLPRLGERIIALASGIQDATTGCKAMRKDLVALMEGDFAYGGLLIVRAKRRRLRIVEVPIVERERVAGFSVHSGWNIFKKSLKFVGWAARSSFRRKMR